MGCSGSIESNRRDIIPDSDGTENEALEQEALLGIRSKLVKHKITEDIFTIFNNIKVLGDGMSGNVYEVNLKSNPERLYALKQMKKSNINPELIDQLFLEIALLIEMDHPNVIKLYDTYEDSTSIYLCMEV